MRVTVVGTGYVGLVTGCCLAEAGHEVTCVDNDEAKVKAMRAGQVPIFEPGLEKLMTANAEAGRLSFTTSLADGIKDAQAIFLALPTPSNQDGSADLSYILEVAKQLGPLLPKHYCVVIDKSTVPVGSAEQVREAIGEGDFDVVSNPEFLREGFAVKDFMEPERVMVGVTTKQAEELMRELYAPFINEQRPLFVTDPRTAELTKYAANAFLVTKISFMNEMAELCERLGADVEVLRQAIGADSRIGAKFLYPGIGSGGSCFPKDVRALKHMADQAGHDFKIIKAATSVNEQQPLVLFRKVNEHFQGKIAGKRFALWGLAFKPNTDDIRDAPALAILETLLAAGASVKAYDPEAGNNVRALYKDKPGLTVGQDKYEILKNTDALLLATEWDEFKQADLAEVAKNTKVFFDGRNVFQPDDMQKAGFTYYSIGRQPVVQ